MKLLLVESVRVIDNLQLKIKKELQNMYGKDIENCYQEIEKT